MFNFVICDDEVLIRKKVLNIISKLMMPIESEYKTYEFESYNKEFDVFIDKKIGKKIYILDVEMNKKSGLDVARKIREKDWQSIIIILTAHYELSYEAFKGRLMLLDYICKFDDYETKLLEVITLAIKILSSNETFNFVYNRITYKVPFEDILYIKKDETARKLLVKTFYKDYTCMITLSECEQKLGLNFLRTHRACIINYNNIKKIDFKNNIILFKNNEKTNLLSKNYKKEVRKICS